MVLRTNARYTGRSWIWQLAAVLGLIYSTAIVRKSLMPATWQDTKLRDSFTELVTALWDAPPLAFAVLFPWLITFPAMMAALSLMLIVGPAWLGIALALGRIDHRPVRGAARLARSEPVRRLFEGVERCGALRACGHASAGRTMRRLSKEQRGIESVVLGLHRVDGRTSWRGPRRRALKRHAQLVAAALRRAEELIDVDRQAGATELARLYVKIAERYTQARLGALLDEEELEDLQPVRDWEPVRLAAAAVLIAAAALAVTLAGLPDAAVVYVIGACAVLVLVILYGRRVHSAVRILELLRGP
ncbi:hypothetical protein ACFV9W_03460 [Streptomyces sp. NPDC059897]|uniref:hypothetical protein n=1 Tax=Streptomyces sp. NPDC059897 TaxID=3346994 RepID=UPI0036599D57